MKTIICDNLWKEKWDDFVMANAADGGFFQSWAWGEFQKQIGREIFKIAITDNSENIKAAVQLIMYGLPMHKKYFYAPRGPVCSNVASEEFKIIIKEIKRAAYKKGAIFVRIDPPFEESTETKTILKNIGFNFVGEAQPKQTLILDLGDDDNEILAKMKSKTRYNIKVAQKHCVTIDEGKEYFEDFWVLMQKTAMRDKLTIHSKRHYQKMLEALNEDGVMRLVVAKFEDKIVAANLMVIFDKWCIYLHGASDYDYRDKMAPYLLQWESILFAKSRGCENYDFWGANEQKWPGVTRFKMGFAPERKLTEYVGAFDMKINYFWYWAYKVMRKFFKAKAL